jgi:hypothetical protein
MGLFVLDVILWIFGTSGHIPQHDRLPAGGSGSPFAANSGTRIRVLVAVLASIGFLALALWAAVWLAIRLL